MDQWLLNIREDPFISVNKLVLFDPAIGQFFQVHNKKGLIEFIEFFVGLRIGRLIRLKIPSFHNGIDKPCRIDVLIEIDLLQS